MLDIDIPQMYKHLIIRNGCIVYSKYPKLEIDTETEIQLLKLSAISPFYKPHVLHVSKNKLNNWIIKILLDTYGDAALSALCALNTRSNKRNFYTVHAYKKYIENYLKL